MDEVSVDDSEIGIKFLSNLSIKVLENNFFWFAAQFGSTIGTIQLKGTFYEKNQLAQLSK